MHKAKEPGYPKMQFTMCKRHIGCIQVNWHCGRGWWPRTVGCDGLGAGGGGPALESWGQNGGGEEKSSWSRARPGRATCFPRHVSGKVAVQLAKPVPKHALVLRRGLGSQPRPRLTPRCSSLQLCNARQVFPCSGSCREDAKTLK